MENNSLNCEPMDIDLSSQSVKEMDISYNDSANDSVTFTRPSSDNLSPSPKPQSRCSTSPIKQPAVRNCHIIIQKAPRVYKTTYTLCKIISIVFVIFISIVTYQIQTLQCCDQLNIEMLRGTLSNKLYGQSAAVNILINTLETNSNSKLLFFSGSTGVGKSYTSSLLMNTLGSCTNIYHYTMPFFEKSFSTELMFGFNICKTSFIIVDDLTVNDNMNIKEHIKNLIEKSVNLKKRVTVILIYSCNQIYKDFNMRCDRSMNNKLMENFSDIKTLKRIIHFESLSEEHLKQCIQDELGSRKLSEIEFKNVLKNFNVSIDGCKGVHSKMKYLITV